MNQLSEKSQQESGLLTLPDTYKVIQIQQLQLYTWILVDLNVNNAW